jgi:tetratricopeptide (TPR) repeat protein
MMNLLLLIASFSAVSSDATSLFNEANEAYNSGKYDQAIEGYTTLLTGYKIKSPALLYNLGNAHMEKGSLGSAILNYEAALLLEPGFQPARKSLEKALGATKRNLPPPDAREVDQRLLARYYPLTPMQSFALTCAALAASLIMLLLHHWRRQPRLRWLCISLFFLGAALQAMTIAHNYTWNKAPRLAVTLTKEAPVYFSTAETEKPRFLLYEGDRILVDRMEGDWVRVHAHGGERGWTKKENAGIVSYGIM